MQPSWFKCKKRWSDFVNAFRTLSLWLFKPLVKYSPAFLLLYAINFAISGTIISFLTGERKLYGYADFFLISTALKNPLEYTNSLAQIYGFIILIAGWLFIPMVLSAVYELFSEIRKEDAHLKKQEATLKENIIRIFKGEDPICPSGHIAKISQDTQNKDNLILKCDTCGFTYTYKKGAS
jgi:hypothetical protein